MKNFNSDTIAFIRVMAQQTNLIKSVTLYFKNCLVKEKWLSVTLLYQILVESLQNTLSFKKIFCRYVSWLTNLCKVFCAVGVY